MQCAVVWNSMLKFCIILFQSKSSFDLNVGACRIVLGILPGLEMQVLADTEGLIKRLFDWATNSKEPLQSYATGNYFANTKILSNLENTSFERLKTAFQDYACSIWASQTLRVWYLRSICLYKNFVKALKIIFKRPKSAF